MRLWIPGTPKPQPRPNATTIGGKARVYSPKLAWRKTVAGHVRAERHPCIPAPRPVAAELLFVLPRPPSHYRTGRNAHLVRNGAPNAPTGGRTGDADNYAKAVLDELNGVLFDDDTQVTRLVVEKRYAHQEPTGCLVIIEEIQSEEAA